MFNATRIRLYPTAAQCQTLSHQFGCARWIYNWGLDLSQRTYRETGKGLTYYKLATSLPALKKEHEWLKQADSQALQMALNHLANAFDAFFRGRNRYPTFRSKHGKQSYSYPQRVKITERRSNGWGLIALPKVGSVRAKIHREIVGKIKTVTISKDCAGRYWAAILTDDGVDDPAPLPIGDDLRAVGIDVGIKHFAITSDGRKIANRCFVKRAERNLKRKQQALSRKKKGSNRRNKARLKVARAHERVRRARTDFLHKLSRQLVNENQVIAVEDLNVRGMMKNKRLAKSIGDCGWSMFKKMLTYKAEREGKRLVECHRFYPSTKSCNNCHHVNSDVVLGVETWDCPKCGTRHDRDINAAKNIRDEGLRILLAEGRPATASGGRVSRNARQTHDVSPRETGSPALKDGEASRGQCFCLAVSSRGHG